MEFTVLVGILGTVASIAGLAAAFAQGVRLRQLKRRTNNDIWIAVRTILSIMGKLESSPSRKQDSAVAEVYGRLVDLYRHLLKQAALDEKDFTEDTISRWRAAGKINTDWQAAQARYFLSTNEIALAREPNSKKTADDA